MSGNRNIIEVIESSLMELNYILLHNNFKDEEAQSYASIIKLYLENDGLKLKNMISSKKLSSKIYHLACLRLMILKNTQDMISLSHFMKFDMNNSQLEAEKKFILGIGFLRINENLYARDYFQKAYRELDAVGAKKKALKALMNMVVAESRINNKKRLIGDYELIAEKAKEIDDKIIEGICMHNVSKEFQRVGGFELALKYANHSVKLMKNDVGTIHYYEIILHRCHVLIDLGRYQQAYLDFDRAKLSNHPQTKNALKCIEIILGEEKIIPTSYLEPAWRSKISDLKEKGKQVKLTSVEMQFLELIRKNEVSKNRIISSLYGNKIDRDVAKNRFKVFISRFRKRYPELIISTRSGYVLRDETILHNIVL